LALLIFIRDPAAWSFYIRSTRRCRDLARTPLADAIANAFCRYLELARFLHDKCTEMTGRCARRIERDRPMESAVSLPRLSRVRIGPSLDDAA
jgi:hypothetical protein